MTAIKEKQTIRRATKLFALAMLAHAPTFGTNQAQASEVSGASLTVKVSTFRNKEGFLGCRLYRSSAGFPESSAGTTEQRASIDSTTATCIFNGLPSGTWAVSVVHDENGNGKLDKNFFGIPKEGYGVSNNHTHAMSAPTWDESKLVIQGGTPVTLSISLRY